MTADLVTRAEVCIVALAECFRGDGEIVANPIGTILAFAGSSAPAGHILCDGIAVSRTTYSALFGVIGTTYGAGDGSTTFNPPDLRGRALFGVDNMGGTAANRVTSAVSGITGTTLGAVGGDQHAQADTITVTKTGSITASSAVTDPGHVHAAAAGFQFIDYSGPGGNLGGLTTSGNEQTETDTASATTGITVATTITDGTTVSATSGLTGATQNMPPTLMVNYIIFAGV